MKANTYTARMPKNPSSQATGRTKSMHSLGTIPSTMVVMVMTLSTVAKAGTAYTVPSGMTNCLEPPGKTMSTVMTATTICMVARRGIS